MTNAADVLDNLGMSVPATGAAVQQSFPMSDEERHLFNYIRWEPQHIDEIAVAAGLTSSQSGALLTLRSEGCGARRRRPALRSVLMYATPA